MNCDEALSRASMHGDSVGYWTPRFFMRGKGAKLMTKMPKKTKLTGNVETALLVRAIWRLSEGNVHKYLPARRVPKDVKRFLDSGQSIQDRRAGLVAILQSIIAEEAETP